MDEKLRLDLSNRRKERSIEKLGDSVKNHLIYCLTDNTNGKIYIGRTGNELDKRWHSSNLIERFGHDNLKKEVLMEGLNAKEVGKKEKEFIGIYKSTNSDIGYNISKGSNKSVRISKNLNLTEKEMLKYEIEPCPFCGNRAGMFLAWWDNKEISLSCPECGCFGPRVRLSMKFSEDDMWDLAVKSWNTRRR